MSTESGMVLVPRVLVECVANILEIEKYSVDGCMIKGLREALAASPASPPTPAVQMLSEDDVQWIVNDNAELGVKIGEQFFFCYKGHSLVYKSGLHDDDSRMHWRPVFKREFGECVHPVNWKEIREFGHEKTIGTVSLDDSDEWQLLPEPPK